MTTLSVIIPVYNEAGTIGALLDQLLAKKLDRNVAMQIIAVVSPSTDGTGIVLSRYSNRIQIIHEDSAMGKGHAVRTGIKHATGDIILIQDGDLEYSIDDYDRLLQPILDEEADFVLGNRHGYDGPWIRTFSGSPLKAWMMNVGHWIFATMLNTMFHARLQDPFTMFKVFRRSCVDGAVFRCNRFDFDFELVITLLRRGYIPKEIPVRYKSRCFNQGKKVRMLKDPPMWIWTMIRMRLFQGDA